MHTGKGRGAVGVRSEKLSHKNAIKHEKSGPPRFSDNPKYPPKKNLAQIPRTPPGFPTTVDPWDIHTDNYSGCSFVLAWIMLSFV
jgi:hypothetical protein